MDNFRLLTKNDLLAGVNIRRYETKIGEVAECNTSEDFEKNLTMSGAKYVVVGIPEDAGVLANFGKPGTHTLWKSFLKSFLNIQSNDYLKGNEIFIAGYFDFSQELRLINATAPDDDERITALRRLVQQTDNQVEEIVKIICRQNKVPVLIGGGHNNAYGAIKGAAKGLCATDTIPLAQIGAINLDAHTDYRIREGRHSGNAFRYADEDGYLHKYFVIGVHENYFQQYLIRDLEENHFTDYVTYEDIFIREKLDFRQAIARAISFVEDNYTGIELDVDSIERALSSAATPCGLTVSDARRYLSIAARECNVAYLHICEGAVEMEGFPEDPLTGKLVSYLVTDFVKGHLEITSKLRR